MTDKLFKIFTHHIVSPRHIASLRHIFAIRYVCSLQSIVSLRHIASLWLFLVSLIKRTKQVIIVLLSLFCFLSEARVYIDMGKAKVQKSLVALTPFVYDSDSSDENHIRYGDEVFKGVRKNLQSSGYFDLIPSRAFIENSSEVEMEPYPRNPRGFRWENWKLIKTEFLMFTRYSVTDDEIKLQVYMYDVRLRKKLFEKKYTSQVSQRKVLGDLVCNDIIQHLTDKPGIFLTKIVAIRNTGGTKKELFLMDWDGARSQQISFHRSIVVSPMWSPAGTKVAYTAYVYRRSTKGRRANIFLYDLKRKKRSIIASNYGTNLISDFFPSGREMLVTLSSRYGGMNIFRYSIKRRRLLPVLIGPRASINVEPSIHPKNKQIVFSSNRNRKVHLFSMNQYGENLKQLTFTGSYNSSPDWSPDGRYVVFSGYSGRRFDLFILDTQQNNRIRRLTSFKRRDGRWANNESPSFSPDGRQIVFVSDRTGNNQIYTIHTDGSHLSRLTFDKHHYKTPRWSPLITKVISQ